MVQLKTGNIFEENAEALVNSVNCVGVMGRGIALQFKNRFPENFKSYAKACKRGEVKPGANVRLHDRSADQSTLYHQLPYKASLARQEPHRGY